MLSGPSGVGKSTLVTWLREHVPTAWISVSATTRPPREGEVNGFNYHFVSDTQFDELVATGALLEWAQFSGNRYGTPRAPVEERLAAGESVLLEIDLEGARQIRRAGPPARLVFLQPPSWEVLRQRLVGRGTESPEVIERRLERARVELAAATEFDEVIVNDDIDAAGRRLASLLGVAVLG